MFNLSSLIKVNAPYKKIILFARNFKLFDVQLKNAVNLIMKKNQVIFNNELRNQIKAIKHINAKNISLAKNLEICKNMINDRISNKLSRLKEIVELKSHQISQINPRHILKKGYAIIRDREDKIIKDTVNLSFFQPLMSFLSFYGQSSNRPCF